MHPAPKPNAATSLDPETYRRARLSRDPRFDGEFFSACAAQALGERCGGARRLLTLGIHFPKSTHLYEASASWRPWRAYAANLLWRRA